MWENFEKGELRLERLGKKKSGRGDKKEVGGDSVDAPIALA